MDAIIDMNDFSVTITPSKRSSDARDDSGYYEGASAVVADEYVNPGVGDAAAHIPAGTFDPQPGPSYVNTKNQHLRQFAIENKNKNTQRKTQYGL